MNINKETLKQFRGDLKDALSSLENKYGITFDIGGISYSSTDFHLKLNALNCSSEDAEIVQFKKDVVYFKGYGIDESMYNKTFRGSDGKDYVLFGLNPKARKNFCKVRSTDGSSYVCHPNFLGIKVA